MNRNESFPALDVSAVTVHLAWASLEMIVDDVEDIQVLVSGDAGDVEDLKLLCQEGRLLVEQPTYGINIKQLNAERWMQIFLRIPRAWKGAVEASTVTGPLKARGLTGTDLSLGTVSGDLRAAELSSITTTLHTVSGDVKASDIGGERLTLRTVSGDALVNACGFDSYRVATVSGGVQLDMTRPLDKLEGTTVSGDVRIYAPITAADATLRSVTGRLRTSGVSIQPGAAPIGLASVSGNLEINCSLTSAHEEE